ncbi:MAG: hypothetical protein ACLQDI_01610, partial [Syntrophobacteraceae bacterium]
GDAVTFSYREWAPPARGLAPLRSRLLPGALAPPSMGAFFVSRKSVLCANHHRHGSFSSFTNRYAAMEDAATEGIRTY